MSVRVREEVTSLCDSCTRSRITVDRLSRRTVLCQVMGYPVRVEADIVRCNEHNPIGQMDEYDAKKIGWVLEVKGTRVVGFKPPKADKD